MDVLISRCRTVPSFDWLIYKQAILKLVKVPDMHAVLTSEPKRPSLPAHDEVKDQDELVY